MPIKEAESTHRTPAAMKLITQHTAWEHLGYYNQSRCQCYNHNRSQQAAALLQCATSKPPPENLSDNSLLLQKTLCLEN